MQYRITIQGETPLITHDVIAGLDVTSDANAEKSVLARKRAATRTESDEARIRELDCYVSIWTTESGEIGVPRRALRAMLEASAKTLRQGSQVRQGLQVLASAFQYDKARYGSTREELARSSQFTVPVRVQQSTINRTRAKFDPPWSCEFVVNVVDDLVDQGQLTAWLDIGGSRIGIGDWRPSKSG